MTTLDLRIAWWIECPKCGEKKIEVRHRPDLPSWITNADGNIELSCRICDKDSWDACADIQKAL